MTTDSHKRLEEAAKKYQEEYETTERVAFTHGAIWGYNEAIGEAMEWLKNHLGKDNGTPYFIKAFETDMNKLWEEKK